MRVRSNYPADSSPAEVNAFWASYYQREAAWEAMWARTYAQHRMQTIAIQRQRAAASAAFQASVYLEALQGGHHG